MHPRGRLTSLPPVRTQEFDGPLDLLLEEVRRQNVEIESIALAPMVSRFLEYMATAAGRNLNLDIDWLHMAATLIHWKSQALLPSEPGGTVDRDPIRDQIIQQLQAHSRQVGLELGRRHSLEQDRFSRPVPGAAESSEALDPPLVSVWDMIQQARELARWVETHRAERSQWRQLEVERDDVTVAEMIEYLRAHVPATDYGKVDGASLMRDQPTTSRRACLFLGLLEMARNRELHLIQDEGFGPIWIRSHRCILTPKGDRL
ncbi:MAG: segregation/condensation protein A [Candidatus Solibacter sp.]